MEKIFIYILVENDDDKESIIPRIYIDLKTSYQKVNSFLNKTNDDTMKSIIEIRKMFGFDYMFSFIENLVDSFEKK